jgi:hypothetical protein
MCIACLQLLFQCAVGLIIPFSLYEILHKFSFQSFAYGSVRFFWGNDLQLETVL